MVVADGNAAAARGVKLTSSSGALKIVFWIHVAGNAIGFPVGTVIAGVCFWLWREARTP